MRLLINIFFVLLFAAPAWARDAQLTWLGHSAFLYQSQDGQNILIDPWIQNPKAPKDFKLPKIDAILVTHGHSDHVGQAFELATSNNCPLFASYELTEIAKKKGVKNVSPLNPQGSATLGDVTVTAVEAVHSSSYADGDNIIYAGAPIGFVIQEKGAPTFYHAGDTGVFESMSLIKSMYHPELALLPIGGVFTMKPQEAAVAAKMLGIKAVVPMHFGTFPALAGTPAELEKNLQGSKIKVREMIPGKTVTIKSLL